MLLEMPELHVWNHFKINLLIFLFLERVTLRLNLNPTKAVSNKADNQSNKNCLSVCV